MLRTVIAGWWLGAAFAGPGLFEAAPLELVVSEPSAGAEQRWRVDGVLVGVRPGDAGARALCVGPLRSLVVHGTDPRELSPEVRSVLDEACDVLRSEAPPAATPTPLHARPLRLRPHHGLALVFFLALPFALPRLTGAWLVASLALALRVLLTEPRILMGVDYAYQRLLAASGNLDHHVSYGWGWPALQSLPWRALGGGTWLAHHLNLGWSVLTVAWLYEAVRRITGDEARARDAGLMLAVLSVPIALAWTEGHFVAVAALQAAAVATALGEGRRPWFAAIAIGLLPHVRPLQLLVVPALLGLLAWRRQRGPLALACGLVLWRVAELAPALWGSDDPLASARTEALQPQLIWDNLLGAGSPTLVLDPWTTPFWLLPLAVVALWRAPMDRAVRAALGWMLLVTVLTALHQDRLTDRVRFQLPALTWWCALAAMALPARAVRHPAAWVVALTGLWVARSPLHPPSAWTVEHRRLVEMAPELATAERVWFDDVWDRNGHLQTWASAVTGSSWHGIGSGTPRTGDLRWVGRADSWPGDHLATGCTREPVIRWSVRGEGLSVEPLGGEQIELGVDRLDCPSAQDVPALR